MLLRACTYEPAWDTDFESLNLFLRSGKTLTPRSRTRALSDSSSVSSYDDLVTVPSVLPVHQRQTVLCSLEGRRLLTLRA